MAILRVAHPYTFLPLLRSDLHQSPQEHYGLTREMISGGQLSLIANISGIMSQRFVVISKCGWRKTAWRERRIFLVTPTMQVSEKKKMH